MVKKRILSGIAGAAICTFLVNGSALAVPTTYDGITFPGGDISFADQLVDLTFGDPAPTAANFIDGNQALGAPDYTGGGGGTGSVSLGRGGTITVRFTDNALTGSGDNTPDLHIFEVGPDIEDTFVSISEDGNDFIDVGKVEGATSSIDIDFFLDSLSIDVMTQFFFVRLMDDPNEGGSTGNTVGADIDAIGAISTVFVSDPVPLPAAAWMFMAGLGGIVATRRARKAS